jgi:myosin-5
MRQATAAAAAVVTVTQAARAQDSPARRLIAWLRLLFRECRPRFSRRSIHQSIQEESVQLRS